MALDDDELREKLAQVYARQDFYEACTRGDAGAMITILGDHRVTQNAISARTGLAQSTLSNYKRGKNRAEWASTLKKLADGLEMPRHLREALGVAGAAPSPGGSGGGLLAADIPADAYDLQRLAETIGQNGTTLKRRDLLSLGAKLGAATAFTLGDVWERLAHALSSPSAAVEEPVVRKMEARSDGFHRLEEIMPATILLKGLTVHLGEVTTLLNSIPADSRDMLRKRLIVAAGEGSVLASWAASDMGDSAAARNFSDTALKAAEEADDPALAACALAYRSYIPSTKGASGRSRVLLSQALEIIPRQKSPATLAWIAARHAEESAIVGDESQAVNSWREAEEAYSMADTEDDRVWTRFLDRNRFDSYHIATFAKIGKLDEAQEIAQSVLSHLDQLDRKKAAIILEDIATAHLARGRINDASASAKSGITVLRETGFTMWLPRFESLAQALSQWHRQTQVRAYLDEFAVTKRQFAHRQLTAPPPPARKLGKMHRSRICQFVIDVPDLGKGVEFWTAALDATEETISESSRQVYRRIILPDSDIRILLQGTGDPKISKERMHIDVETDDVEAEVRRLEALGAIRWDHQQERGFDYWVLRDPWGNEFCVLQQEFPELLARRRPWPTPLPES